MSRTQFSAVLLAGVLLRAIALPGGGTPDVGIWKVWSYSAVRHGVGGLYGVGGAPPERRLLDYLGTTAVVDYPPLTLYELDAAGQLHRLWSHRRFPNDGALHVAVKLPALAGDCGIALLLFFVVRRRIGEGAARWAVTAYWLNPAVLLDGAALGYLDLPYVFPALAAIVAASTGAAALAGALIAASILTKAQGLFIAPAVALALWTIGPADARARLRRFAIAGAAAVAVAVATIAQIVVAGGWPNMVQALSRLAYHDALSAQACNLWWLVGWALRVRYSAADMGLWPAIVAPARILAASRVVELGYPDPKPIGAAMVIVAFAWALWTARRTRDVWIAAGVAGFLVHAYATLSAQVHENHLFAAVPMLALAAAGRRSFAPVFAAVSAIVAVNLNLFYGFGVDVGYALPRSITVVDVTVVLAALNCAALWWHAQVLRRACSTEAARPLRPAPA